MINGMSYCAAFAVSAFAMLPALGLLKGVSPVLSPDLLKVLAEMGHGDEIVFADAHFPAHSVPDTPAPNRPFSVPPAEKGSVPIPAAS